MFQKFPDLGRRIYHYFHLMSKENSNHMSVGVFLQQCERFLSIINDTTIIEVMLKIFSNVNGMESINQDGFKELLKTCYAVTLSHTNEHSNIYSLPDQTLDAIIESCFFSKETLSIGFVERWLEQNCPRLVPPLYKYSVFILNSAYRGIVIDEKITLELSSPILEKASSFPTKVTETQSLLPSSIAWLLAGTLDKLYSMPLKVQNSALTTPAAFSQNFKSMLIEHIPSHWTLLYDSTQHGLGSNRFLHHVTGYKGPTLVLVKGESDHVFCIAADKEWKESHVYSGGDKCCVIQLFPKYIHI